MSLRARFSGVFGFLMTEHGHHAKTVHTQTYTYYLADTVTRYCELRLASEAQAGKIGTLGVWGGEGKEKRGT